MPAETEAPILVLNAGSSSIKFALFAPPFDPERPAKALSGSISGIGQPQSVISIAPTAGARIDSPIEATDHPAAIERLLEALREHHGLERFRAVGHRIVHGGPDHFDPERIGPELLAALRRITAFAPEHLPQEIGLIDAIAARFPSVVQVACFDTAFHQDLPPTSRMLPLPRALAALGVRRYGFHGLSYAYLMRELARAGRPGESAGRVILAHLGNGASLAAVRGGKPIDTTMGMTPAGGLVMGTRTGDIDPGVVLFLEKQKGLSPEQFHRLVNHESGLLGISETSADMRQLTASQSADPRAAEAVELFCYSARKWIGAFAAALGGIDTLVFSGGIGEHQADVRGRICRDLGFLGIELADDANQRHAPVISARAGRVTVRVIPTDEEATIFRAVAALLGAAD